MWADDLRKIDEADRHLERAERYAEGTALGAIKAARAELAPLLRQGMEGVSGADLLGLR